MASRSIPSATIVGGTGDTRTVYAFHGTTEHHLPGIESHGLLKTLGGGHWLGDDGIYLVPLDLAFARGYAQVACRRLLMREGIESQPVVLGMHVDLTDCFDMAHDIEKRQMLREIGTELIREMPDVVWPEIRQNQLTRSLDSMVLRQAMRTLVTETGNAYASAQAICSARFGAIPPGVYPPGGPLYQVDDNLKSWFDLHDHLQLIVYDANKISKIERVE